MTQNDIKGIFSQLCKDNDWKLFFSKNSFPLNSKTINYFLIDSNEFKNNIRHPYIKETPLDIDEHLKNLEFLKPEKVLLETSREIEFKVFTHFLTLEPIKNLNIFSLNEQKFKSWYDFIYNFSRVKSDTQDIKTFFKHHTANFGNSDLPSLFNYLGEKEFSNADKHEILSSFCTNHLEKINANLTARNYLLTKIQETLPEYKHFYTSLLFLEDKEELFVEPNLQFKNIFISKNKLVKDFPLTFKDEDYKKDSSADMSDYQNILTFLTNFLNKNKVKNILHFNAAFLNAKQDTKPYYIINLEHTGNINDTAIKSFMEAAFSYISENSRTSPVKNIYTLKDNIKTGLVPLFNSIILQQKLPYKEDNLPKTRKI